jgi:tRNA threonylcarbamoyl adenosine modification protein YeaZ
MPGSFVVLFDTSTPLQILALAKREPNGSLILIEGSALQHPVHESSSQLVPGIEALLARAGITMRDVGLVGCGVGPGTFTGTRVAVATAKGLAIGLGCNVLAIDSLAVVAMSASDRGQVLALIDARRDEVYAAGFDHSSTDASQVPTHRSWLATHCAAIGPVLEAARQAVGEATIDVVGSGVAPYLSTIRANASFRAHPETLGSAQGLVAAAQHAIDAGHEVSPVELSVNYLRASYAELGVNVPKTPLFANPLLTESDRNS